MATDLDLSGSIVNLTCKRGDDIRFALRAKQTIDGSPVYLDLSTYQNGAAQVRDTADSEEVRATFTVLLGSDDLELPAVDGWIILNLPRAETEDADWARAVWDVQLVDSEGKVRTWFGGKFTLSPDVTRVDLG